MNHFQALSRIRGLCVINARGEIAQFDASRKLVRTQALCDALGAEGQQWLVSQLCEPHRAEHRIGLVYDTPVAKTWTGETILMADAVLTRLYPTGATQKGRLTDFQKRNREKSLYRGFELLLEYVNPNSPGIRIFCPVLFSAGLNANTYPEFAESISAEQAETTPVLEVLNLISLLPQGVQKSTALIDVAYALHAGVVRKDMRRSSGLTLLEDVRRAPETAKDTAVGFYDADRRTESRLTITDPLAQAARTSHSSQKAGPVADNLDRWLKIPHESITPAVLRRFLRLRQLDPMQMEMLVKQCPVHTAPLGTCLLNRGSHDSRNLFLLEGKVALEAGDGGIFIVEGGTEHAGHALAALKPRQFTVSALTPVSFFIIPDALLASLSAARKTG